MILKSDRWEKQSLNHLIRLYFKSEIDFFFEMLHVQNEVTSSGVFYYLAIYNADKGNIVESVILFSKISKLSLTSEQIDTFFKNLFANANISDVMSILRCYLNLNDYKEFLICYFKENVVSNLNDVKNALYLTEGFMNVYSSILYRYLSLCIVKSSLSDKLINRSRNTYVFPGIDGKQ